MDAFYDTLRANGVKRAEHNTWRYSILQLVTSIVNYIKPHPLRARLFAKLCGDMGSEHDHVLFHTDGGYRGGMLEILRVELLSFTMDKRRYSIFFKCSALHDTEQHRVRVQPIGFSRIMVPGRPSVE